MPDRRGYRAPDQRYPRTARVNEVLREIVAEELEALGDHDERLHLLTVTGVRSDPDLRRAVVFYSARHAEAETALGEQRVRVQAAIGRQTRFRRTPLLSFVPDPAVSTGWRIEGILRNLNKPDPVQEHGDDAGG